MESKFENYNPKVQLIFSGALNMWNYLFGVISIIRHLIQLDKTVVISSSSGNIPALFLFYKGDIKEFYYSYYKKKCDEVKLKYTTLYFNLYSIYEHLINEVIDVVVKKSDLDYINKNKVFNVKITEINDYFDKQTWKSIIVNKFDDKTDMTKAIISSSFIPFLYNITPYMKYKNMRVGDSYLSETTIKPIYDLPTLVLHPEMWESCSAIDYMPDFDFDKCKEKFELGRRHALEHYNEIEEFLDRYY
jgi:hypothetical protein